MASKPFLRSPTSISLPGEPWLEKWARAWRFARAFPYIREKFVRTYTPLTLIDFGCGQDTLLYTYLQDVCPENMSHFSYIGIDPLITARKGNKRIRLLQQTFETVSIREKADVITMFAVLEHVDDPMLLLRTALRALKPQGTIVVTTPSPLAKPFLEFFAYILHVISTREIGEHKRYPTRNLLLSYVSALQKDGMHVSAEHHYFEGGLNNLLIIRKE